MEPIAGSEDARRSTGRLKPRGAVASPIPFCVEQLRVVPLAFSIGALALAHLFDYASFIVMVDRYGIGAEANPVVVHLANQLGLPGLTLAKIATVTFAALLMILIAPQRRRLAMGLLMFGVSAGLVGGISNIATL